MVFCHECGSKLVDNAKFCSSCGAKVNIITTQDAVSTNLIAEPVASPLPKQQAIDNNHKKSEYSSKSPIGISFDRKEEVTQTNEQETKVSLSSIPVNKVEPASPEQQHSEVSIPETKEIENETIREVINVTHNQSVQPKTLYKKLEIFRDKLLQVDWRNRAIMLSKIYEKWNFDLGRIFVNDKKLEQKFIENAFSAKRPINIIPDSIDSEEDKKDSKKMKILYRNTIQIERETGRNETYLGFPFLSGHLPDGTFVRGPIVLFPVEIDYRKNLRPLGWYVIFSKDKKPILNRALLEAIKKVGRIRMSENLYDEFDKMIDSIEEEIETNSIDKQKIKIEKKSIESIFIDKLYTLFDRNQFSIKKQDDNFDIKILEPISSEDRKKMQRQDLHFANLKIIGNFPQGDTAIYSDYLSLLKEVESGVGNIGIIDNLLEVPSYEDVWNDGQSKDEDEDIEKFDIDKIPSIKMNLVIESDSSQENVILASNEQECTIVRGPPGTGKSQVIVNLIADAIIQKKKVLVVCQKRAALDVVYQRLERVGISRYAGLIHDYNADRAELYRKLLEILESYVDTKNYDYVTSRLNNISAEIDNLVQQQKKIGDSLHKKYFGGISIHQLYAATENTHSTILDLSDFVSEIDYHSVSNLAFIVKTFEENGKKYNNQEYPWKDRVDFSDFSVDEKTKISSLIEKLIEFVSANQMISHCITCNNIEEQQKLVSSIEILATQGGFFRKFKSEWSSANNYVKHLLKLDNDFNSTDKSSISKFEIMAKNGLDGWNIINQFSNYLNQTKKEKLVQLFVSQHFNTLANDLKKMKETLVEFESVVEFDKRKREIESDGGPFKTISFKTFKSEWSEAYSTVKKILKLNDNYDFTDKNKVIELDNLAKNGLDGWNIINQFSNYVNQTKKEKLVQLFVSQDFNILANDLKKMKEALVEFESMVEFDRRKQEIESPIAKRIVDECLEKLPTKTGWDEIVKNEIYYHWIKYIESKNPLLTRYPFETYLQNRQRLAELLKEQTNLNKHKLVYQIENNIPRETIKIGGSRRRNRFRDSWSELQDDLGKKRRVLPVRKLIEKYNNSLFRMAPCWLASPEAVSAIFPFKRGFFDLIIFDEASQSAVERSLPTLYRGSRIVILGDEKQLRPFDLFKIKDEDEDYEYDEEVDESLLSESLLVLAKRIYGHKYLSWHYRSKFQELIDFSNHSFYDGHLYVAPNVFRSGSSSTPISWIRCENGVLIDRKNIPEASLVVDELKKILVHNINEYKKSKEMSNNIQSVGIITFNDPQKEIILDEIDRRRQIDTEFDEAYAFAEDRSKHSLDDIPFVKNIENVQGDERDIIIFSVGYAKDSTGKFHVRFGTLNQEGGENRLNVAITRARQRVMIISSIEPEEMDIENTKNAGPKRLKEYLQYAKYVSEGNIENVKNILTSVNNRYDDGFRKQEIDSLLDVRIEEKVKKSLSMAGFEVESYVGSSNYRIDLAVVHPQDSSRYILGIECDGKSFESASSVKERDIIRQQFLEGRGWKIEKSWSKNWWQDPNRELERLIKIIKQIQNEGSVGPVKLMKIYH